MKTILSLLLVASLQLHAMPSMDDISNLLFGKMNEILDGKPPIDSWDMGIQDNDDSVPDEEDRIIATKTINKPFTISLASLNINNDDYETKEADDEDANNSIELTIFENENNTSISKSVYWDPTDIKHTESDPFLAFESTQDAQIKFHMCAAINSQGLMDMISGIIDDMMGGIGMGMGGFTSRSTDYTNTNFINDMMDFFSSNSTLIIYPLGECSGTPTDCEFSLDKQLVDCYSTDHFAIKPDKFSFSLPTYIKATRKETLEINATKFNSSVEADGYNFTTDDYTIDINTTKYMPTSDINNSLNGDSTLVDGNFSDGSSIGFAFNFNDTAKINLKIIDTHWAKVDENDTPQNCDGGWICGDANTTVIPDHFTFTELKLYNEDNKTFTYLANEDEIQAHVGFKVEARSADDNITVNFDKASWENPLSILVSLPNDSESNKTEILDTKIDFEDGKKVVLYDDNTTNRFLSFNYLREVNATRNPFVVDGSEVEVVASSLYDDENITGESNATQEVVFLYARTNVPRTRVINSEGNATLYYEVYCYTKNGSTCDKTLLPDSNSSSYNDDPRWFTNTYHDSASLGTIGSVTQKHTNKVEGSDEFTTVKLNYTGSTYPYKATMLNAPSSWLVYNKYNSSATQNEFEIEFDAKATEWAGEKDENLTTVSKSTASQRTNRRIMW